MDFVLRDLLTQIGGLSQCTTEFVRVTDKLNPPHVFYKYCPELKNGGQTAAGVPVWVQLLGSSPETLSENADLAIELGAPGIDLNFGCPAKTVNRHDGGATLLKTPERLFHIISAVRRSARGRVPVSAKVRLGFDHKNFCLDIAQAVAAGGAHRLTIHARTKLEGYQPPAHWEYIAQMAQAIPQVPVVANGDIWSVEDYWEMVRVTGIHDVALGRGLIARPDLGRQIRQSLEGHPVLGTQQGLKGLLGPEGHPSLGVQHSLEGHPSPETQLQSKTPPRQTENPTPKTLPELSWEQVRQQILPRFVSMSSEFRNSDFALARLKQWTRLLARTYPQARTEFDQIKALKSLDQLDGALRPDKLP